MGVLRRSASTDHHWQAWVSDEDRLLRIARCLETLAAPLREAKPQDQTAEGASADLTRSESERVQTGDLAPSELYTVQLEAREREFSLRQVGPPEDVLKEIDSQNLSSMTLFVGPIPSAMLYPYRLSHLDLPIVVPRLPENEYAYASITLSRSYGALLRVGSSDPSWVRTAFASLKSEIARGVPNWSWLRSNWMWWPYALLGSGPGFIALQPSLWGSLILYVGCALGVGAVVGTAVTLFSKWLLPGFELVPVGRTGRAGRVLGLAGGILLNFALGLLVNVLTRT